MDQSTSAHAPLLAYAPNDDNEAALVQRSDAQAPSALHPRRDQRNWHRIAMVIVAGALLVCLVAVLPLKPLLAKVFEWIHTHPILGSLVYLVAFWIAIPCCLPSTLFEAVGGSLFGLMLGVPLVLLGKTGGSLAAFSMGRYLGQESLGRYLQTRFPSFRAISQLLSNSSAIWKPLLLIQLSSVPNLLKCFALSLTEVSATVFALTLLVGSIPHAVIWAYIGSNARNFMELLSTDSTDGSSSSSMSKTKHVVLFGGLGFTFVAMALLSMYIRQELARLQVSSASESEVQGGSGKNCVCCASTCGSSSDVNETEGCSKSDLSRRHSVIV